MGLDANQPAPDLGEVLEEHGMRRGDFSDVFISPYGEIRQDCSSVVAFAVGTSQCTSLTTSFPSLEVWCFANIKDYGVRARGRSTRPSSQWLKRSHIPQKPYFEAVLFERLERG